MSEVDKLLDGINGSYAPGAKQGHHMHCDECNEIVYPNSDIALYATDWEILDRIAEGQFVKVLRAYCEDCRRPFPYIPMKGVVELLIYCRLDKNKQYREAKIEGYSVPDDGRAWNPKEVMDWFFPEPVELTVLSMGGADLGPEDVVSLLLKYNMDPREIIDEDGTLIDTPQTRKKRDDAIQQMIEETDEEEMAEALKRFEDMQEYDYTMGGYGATEEQKTNEK